MANAGSPFNTDLRVSMLPFSRILVSVRSSSNLLRGRVNTDFCGASCCSGQCYEQFS